MAKAKGKAKSGTGPVGSTVSPAEAQAAFKVGVSIVVALVLGGPGLLKAAAGTRDFVGAAWWFFLSLVAARVGVAIVFGVWLTYRRSIDEERLEAQRREFAAEVEQRRAALAASELDHDLDAETTT